jgi:thiol:disulfide interchange protein DsbA
MGALEHDREKSMILKAILFAVVAASVGACGHGVYHSVKTPTEMGTGPEAVIGSAGVLWHRGRDFDVISYAPPASGGRVEVVEFFWYECPHCYMLESHLVIWNRKLKPKYVDFVRVPATWSASQQAHARFYYALKELGREDLHNEVFDAIHRMGNPLYDKDERLSFQRQLEFVRGHGVNSDDFERVYHSPTVDADLRRAAELAERYHVEHVPTMIVDGKYTTDLRRARRNEYELLEIVDALVANEKRSVDSRISPGGAAGDVSTLQVAAKQGSP